MEQKRDNSVSIIIVTYNSLPSLVPSLQSLKKVQRDRPFELILVDNNSTDDSIESARRIFPECKIIKNEKNIGFAAACNLGAEKAVNDFLLFYNPDLEIDPDAVTNFLNTYSEYDNIGALGGRMRFPDGTFQATCRKFPTISNMVFSRGSIFSMFSKRDNRYTLPDYGKTSEVDAVAGTLMMIKKDLFITCGRFDRRFFMYMEDTDICYRLKQLDYHNYFVPTAGGVHLWGEGSDAGKTRRLLYHHISVWKYFVKHFPNGISVIILPLLLTVNFLIKLLLPGKK